jgi:eukaryotic-like serine/threonine-protein kinase
VKTCPLCGKEYADDTKFCPVDGATLRAKSPTANLVGQVVADRYAIIKKLGEGGMGAVYLGEHVKMGRKSAIKVMNPSMAADPDAISRFNREASNASRISHPNVCQIYDFGETPDGVIYLAMEFIEGRSLTDVIEHEGALPPARAVRILRQAADALTAAHDLGIVHRDLKPDNIMIVRGKDGSDVVKVVDFGIAKAVAGDEAGQKVTKTGLVVGTPEYMSPEQLAGDKLDGRSDIYSLALVFYRMLTGTLPFQADSAQETMIKRLTDDPLTLAAARPDIVYPPGLQTVLDKALARTPAERYGNASQFGKDAEAAVGGRAGTLATDATQLLEARAARQAAAGAGAKVPPTVTARATRKRFPVLPILGGVGGVGVLAAVAVITMNGLKRTPPGPADTTQATMPAGGGTAAVPAGAGDTAAPRETATGSKREPRAQQVSKAVPRDEPRVSTPQPAAPNLPDSLRIGTNLIDSGDSVSARRTLMFVWNSPDATRAQRGEAAFNIAAAYGDDRDHVIQWLRRSVDMGFSAASDALRALGVSP